jgi:lysyl-tRNA synthetase, class I
MEKSIPLHWADVSVRKLIAEKGDKKKYVLAAGITPSGTIHVGNFREIITQELIARSLRGLGKEVRFIYSWDDYDVFRKVPTNLPNQEMLKKELRKPIFLVKDPFGCHGSYAEHFEKEMEESLPALGIEVEFIYQHKEYNACKYAEGIKTALEKRDKIVEIFDKYRKEPLDDSWLPIFVFCEKCKTDQTYEIEWDGKYGLSYKCKCNHEEAFDFRKKGLVTLRWRVDWPMRWDFYNEDFESAGKDHFAAGGSVDTARITQREIYGSEPPYGFAYEWIAIKGAGEFASSKGNVITVAEMLEIYEPAMIRWIFASTRPNSCFNITFDLDVIKLYEDFDRLERIYYDSEICKEREKPKLRRIYELSCVDKPLKKMLFQPSFRHLTNVLQTHEMDIQETIAAYPEAKSPEDKKRIELRAICAKNWLEKFAPEDFKYSVQSSVPKDLEIESGMKEALKQISKDLTSKEWTDKELHDHFYETVKGKDLDMKEFFRIAYRILIDKDKGPQLAHFILIIGKEKVAKLLEQI